MGNFAENLNLGNRFRPPLKVCWKVKTEHVNHNLRVFYFSGNPQTREIFQVCLIPSGNLNGKKQLCYNKNFWKLWDYLFVGVSMHDRSWIGVVVEAHLCRFLISTWSELEQVRRRADCHQQTVFLYLSKMHQSSTELSRLFGRPTRTLYF